MSTIHQCQQLYLVREEDMNSFYAGKSRKFFIGFILQNHLEVIGTRTTRPGQDELATSVQVESMAVKSVVVGVATDGTRLDTCIMKSQQIRESDLSCWHTETRQITTSWEKCLLIQILKQLARHLPRGSWNDKPSRWYFHYNVIKMYFSVIHQSLLCSQSRR